MNLPQAFEVARTISATAGVDQETATEDFRLAAFVARPDLHLVSADIKLRHCPTFAHFGATTLCVLEQEVIEPCALDLISHRDAGEPAIAKGEEKRLAAVAEMELRAVFLDEPRCLQRGQHAHGFEDSLIIRKQRFANVEAGEMLLLQNEHMLPGARQEGRRGAAARAAANHNGVVRMIGHQRCMME